MTKNTSKGTVIFTLVFMLLSMLFVFSAHTTSAQTKFPLDEVIAVIQPVSPDDNMTYGGGNPFELDSTLQGSS